MDGKKTHKKKHTQLLESSVKSPPNSEVAPKTPNRVQGRIAKRKLHQGGENDEVTPEDKPPSAKKKRTRSSSTSCLSSPTSLFKPALTERQQLTLLLQMTDPQNQQQQQHHHQPQQGLTTSPSVVVESSPRDTPGRSKVHKRNERGETPLHLASIKGDTSVVVNLLDQGADINATDHAGWTPLHEACNHGRVDAVLLLIDRGANVNAAGMGGDTPLHDAVINNHIEVVKLLLSRGADPEIRNSHKQSPLDICREDSIRSLLRDALSQITNEDGGRTKDVFSPPEKKPFHPSFLQAHTPPPSHSRTMSLRHEFVRRAETPPPRLHSQSRSAGLKGQRGKVNSRGSFYSDFSSSESDSDGIDHGGHALRLRRMRKIQREDLVPPKEKGLLLPALKMAATTTAREKADQEVQNAEEGEVGGGGGVIKEEEMEVGMEKERPLENGGNEGMDTDGSATCASPVVSGKSVGPVESSHDEPPRKEPVVEEEGSDDIKTKGEESDDELILLVSLPLDLLQNKVKQEPSLVTNTLISPKPQTEDISLSPVVVAEEERRGEVNHHNQPVGEISESVETKVKDEAISASPKPISPAPVATISSPVSETKSLSPPPPPHSSSSPLVTRSVSVMSGGTRRVSSIDGDDDTCSSFPNKETTPTSLTKNSSGEDEDDDDSRSTVVSFSTSLPIVFGSLPASNLCSSSSVIPKRTRSLSPSMLPVKGSGSGHATPIQSHSPPDSLANLENSIVRKRTDKEPCKDEDEVEMKPPIPKTPKCSSPSSQSQATELEKDRAGDVAGPGNNNNAQSLPPKRRISRQVFRSSVINQRRNHSSSSSNSPPSPGPAPHNYDSFLTSKRSYRSLSLPHPRLPKDIYPPLMTSQYKLYTEQEQGRMALLASHVNEVDRLVVCFEQELTRAHQKASLYTLYPPLNACAVLIERLQHQVFSLPLPQQQQDQQLLTSKSLVDNNNTTLLDSSSNNSWRDTSPSGPDDQLLNSYVQDVWDKYHRCSELLASRHKMEVEALWLTQRQQWIERNTDAASSFIPSHVPVAHTGTFPSYVC